MDHNAALLRTINETRYHMNPFAEEGLHPLWTVENYAPVQDPVEALELFYEQIGNIVNDSDDYGDYMRGALPLFLTLKPFLIDEGPTFHRKLLEIEMYLQYTPTWDLKSTHARLRQDIRDLMSWLICKRVFQHRAKKMSKLSTIKEKIQAAG